MKLHFPRLYKNERTAEPCFTAVPFAKGTFTDGMRLRILDGGKEVLSQSKVTGRYADGSVRYLFCRFEADLPANRGKDLDAELTRETGKAVPGIRIVRDGKRLSIDGGAGGLRMTLLEGSGQWNGGRLRFSGEAGAAADMEAQLANLLNIIGVRRGDKVILAIG